MPESATLETFELDEIPVFNQDDEQNPPAKVAALKRRIRETDAILFVSPEYNYSMPGVLKNAIDWASRPYGDSAWNGKPAAIMGASPGAIGTARDLLRELRDGPVKLYNTGESLIEPPGSKHLISENASATEPASMLVVLPMMARS